MLKADLHIHTEFSFDCSMKLDQLVARCLEIGINCVSIADHGTTAGGLKLQAMAPFKVIVAEEILTPFGEIMGAFLTETVPSPSPLKEAIANIEAQGGLVGIPHPFDRLRSWTFGRREMEELLPHVDFVEVFNSRSLLPWAAARASRLAAKHAIPRSAGSDAHSPQEVGNAYIEMPEFGDKDGFLKSLAGGRIHGRRSNPVVHFASTWSRLARPR